MSSRPDIPWQNIVFTVASIPSIPLYVSIIVLILWRRRTNDKYRTTFYSLIISLGIADMCAMLQTGLIQVLRTSYIATEFYWDNRAWIASFSYNLINYTVFLRCFGATLLAYQRYIIVCWGSHFSLKNLLHLPFGVVLLCHWIPPLFPSLPILADWTKTFASASDMTLVVSSDQGQMAIMLQGITVAVLFFACLFPYIQIFRMLVTIRVSQNRNIGRELRLSVIPLGQSICFLVIFFCYFALYIFNVTKNPLADSVRQYMLLVNALLSYWNPWVFLLLNADIQYELRRILCKSQSSPNTVVSQARGSQGSSQPRSFLTR